MTIALTVGWAATLTGWTAAPPPDQLLASDTLAVMTIVDYARARAESAHSPIMQLLDDPALKPFRDHFTAKLTSDLIQPLERELGIHFADYGELAQGQITLAMTRNGWDVDSDQNPAILLLLDAKDRSDVLKTNLVALKRKWVDTGRSVKTDMIRGVEFSTFIFSEDELSGAFERAFAAADQAKPAEESEAPKKPARNVEWIVGQSASLLVMGNSAKAIEKVLIRQSGGPVPPLAEEGTYAARYTAEFREALAYGWVNLKTIFDILTRKAAARAEDKPQSSPLAPRSDKVMTALGLSSMNSFSWSVQRLPAGAQVNVFLGAPESGRKGLTRLLTFEVKDASPPSFVPADAVKFTRWRLDLHQVFTTLEGMLVEAAPQFASVISLVMDNAGKDKDPNFDLRKNFIANLGDDIISFEKAPQKHTLQDLSSPPSLLLISSPRADQLASALQAVVGLLPAKNMRVKERDFLGRHVYTMDLPPTTLPGSRKPVERALHFAASGGYVAFSMEEAMLEEYLRSSSGSGESLRSTAGLATAADAVGGMGTGLFGYENQRETTGAAVDILRKEPGSIANLLGGTPLGSPWGMKDQGNRLKDWLDLSLLPPFDQIARYFYISVWSGKVSADGIGFTLYSPDPPGLRR